MPSASKEKRMAKKAAAGLEKKTLAVRTKDKNASKATSAATSGDDEPDVNGNAIDEPATTAEKMTVAKRLEEQKDRDGISDRITTGVLGSTSTSKDVKIISCSLTFHGRELVKDGTLELTVGRRYGLLGENGCGKSTLLKAIAAREYPIPEHVDIYLLNEGAPTSDLGALEWVVKEAENEMDRLDKLAEKLLEDEGPESPVLMDLYDVSVNHDHHRTLSC
jgi:ATP-binding cassette, subfamily F, member 2